jgi:NADH-quinone oxidoreductase subunit M
VTPHLAVLGATSVTTTTATHFSVFNTTLTLLTILLFLPAVGAVIGLLLEDERQVRIVSVVAVVADLLLAIVLLLMFKYGPAHSGWQFQFADRHNWVSNLGISYWIGLDGISVWLVTLTALMSCVAVLAAQFMIVDRAKTFLIFMLTLETALLGVFMSLNLFLFFVFWEAMLIPSYFLVGIWGEERRVYATMKFLVYTIFGSFFMLVGIFVLWARVGTLDMVGPHGLIAHPVDATTQDWLFLAFAIAFAIKLPVWPFHTWAPTAYTESPIPFGIMLAGLMSKAGAFGFIRYCLPLFPAASRHFAALISILCIIGMVYAALLALVQTDVKRLVAYSSISHMNLICLGIFALNPTALDGSVLQMINHSLIISGLFLAVAYIAARTGTRLLSNMGGLGIHRPWLMWLFFIFILAGLDLPGTSSFAGEFLILLGTFAYNAWYASIATITVVLAAWYMIRMFQNSMNGPVVASPQEAAVPAIDPRRTSYQYPVLQRLLPGDIKLHEALLWVPLAAVLLYLGFQPHPVTQRLNPTNTAISVVVHAHQPSAVPAALGQSR